MFDPGAGPDGADKEALGDANGEPLGDLDAGMFRSTDSVCKSDARGDDILYEVGADGTGGSCSLGNGFCGGISFNCVLIKLSSTGGEEKLVVVVVVLLVAAVVTGAVVSVVMVSVVVLVAAAAVVAAVAAMKDGSCFSNC